MNILANTRLLIVEDDIDNLEFLKRLLQIKGADVIIATSGEEAIEIVREDTSIRLVLMDILLPNMDGYETTKKIKEINPKLPIIAQTAYALFNDREKCIEKGCDDYVPKPIDNNLLLQKIASFLKNN